VSEREQDCVEAWIEDRDDGPIVEAPDSAVRAAVERLLARTESTYQNVDADRLMSVGWALLRGGKETAAGAAVVDWLLAQPSPARLEIGASLLQGFWLRSESGARPQPAHVAALLQARRRIPPSEIADGIAPFALSATLRGSGLVSPLRERVVEELRQAASDPRVNPEMREHLTRVLARDAATG
jgi:hypothetical protein